MAESAEERWNGPQITIRIQNKRGEEKNFKAIKHATLEVPRTDSKLDPFHWVWLYSPQDNQIHIVVLCRDGSTCLLDPKFSFQQNRIQCMGVGDIQEDETILQHHEAERALEGGLASDSLSLDFILNIRQLRFVSRVEEAWHRHLSEIKNPDLFYKGMLARDVLKADMVITDSKANKRLTAFSFQTHKGENLRGEGWEFLRNMINKFTFERIYRGMITTLLEIKPWINGKTISHGLRYNIAHLAVKEMFNTSSYETLRFRQPTTSNEFMKERKIILDECSKQKVLVIQTLDELAQQKAEETMESLIAEEDKMYIKKISKKGVKKQEHIKIQKCKTQGACETIEKFDLHEFKDLPKTMTAEKFKKAQKSNLLQNETEPKEVRLNEIMSNTGGCELEGANDIDAMEATATKAGEEDKNNISTNSDRDLCILCMSLPKTHLAVPCGHELVCDTCIGMLKATADHCPYCRQEVTCWVKRRLV